MAMDVQVQSWSLFAKISQNSSLILLDNAYPGQP